MHIFRVVSNVNAIIVTLVYHSSVDEMSKYDTYDANVKVFYNKYSFKYFRESVYAKASEMEDRIAQKILSTSRTKIFSCFWQKNKRIPRMLRKKGIKARQRVAFRGEWNAKQAAEGAASRRHVLQARHTLSNFHSRAMKFDARPSVLAYDKFRQLLENRAVNYGLLERILLTFTRVPRMTTCVY